jgi:hypothetical protein
MFIEHSIFLCLFIYYNYANEDVIASVDIHVFEIHSAYINKRKFKMILLFF